MTPYERYRLFFYLRNLSTRLHRASLEANNLVNWVEVYYDELVPYVWEKRTSEEKRLYWLLVRDQETVLMEKDWQFFVESLEAWYSKMSAVKEMPEDLLEKRLGQLSEVVELSATDILILEITMRRRTHPIFIDSVLESWDLSGFLGIAGPVFKSRLESDAPLVKKELISKDENGEIEVNDFEFRISGSDETAVMAYGSGLDPNRWLPLDQNGMEHAHRLGLDPKRLHRVDTGSGDTEHACLKLDPTAPAELKWNDFHHVAEQRDHLEKVLKSALSLHAQGVNVLVYGAPGTGKTEFCRVLAARLQASCTALDTRTEKGGKEVPDSAGRKCFRAFS